jgi:V/A-type H+-transporting ATPase subunit C
MFLGPDEEGDMIGRIQKFAFINARLRARISLMMDGDFLASIADCRDLSDYFQKIQQAGYSSVEQVYRDTGDVQAAEAAFWREEINSIEEIKKGAEPGTLQFLDAFLVRYEVDYLKTLLRLWFEREIRKHPHKAFLFEGKLPGCIRFGDPGSLVAAGDLASMATAMKGLPYAEILLSKQQEVRDSESLFPLEIALDRYYYDQLFAVVEILPQMDKVIVRKLLGAEVDLQNLSWLLRFRGLYEKQQGELASELIPHGSSLTAKTLSLSTGDQSMKEFISQIIKTKYSELSLMMNVATTDERSRLVMLERILDEILLIEVRRAMSANPFNIGIIMAYIMMKRAEVRKVRTVLNGLVYGMSKEKIMERL